MESPVESPAAISAEHSGSETRTERSRVLSSVLSAGQRN
jgi:hypothetical protein